jgi:PTS system cellobiose-specific IIA component
VEDLESIIMELLVNAGSARSQALTALQQARKGDFEAAEQAMEESREYVKHAHKIQTQLIGMDEGTGKLPVNLITVHSQDHLMNAMVIQDLAGDMIELYRRIPLVK